MVDAWNKLILMIIRLNYWIVPLSVIYNLYAADQHEKAQYSCSYGNQLAKPFELYNHRCNMHAIGEVAKAKEQLAMQLSSNLHTPGPSDSTGNSPNYKGTTPISHDHKDTSKRPYENKQNVRDTEESMDLLNQQLHVCLKQLSAYLHTSWPQCLTRTSPKLDGTLIISPDPEDPSIKSYKKEENVAYTEDY